MHRFPFKPSWTLVYIALTTLSVLPRAALAQLPIALRPIPSGLGPRLAVEPVASPVPVVSQGRQHLVYELHLASFDSRELHVDRLDILADGGRALASYGVPELSGILFRAGDTLGLPNPHRIAVGTHVIAYLWVVLDSGALAPSSLSHRLRVTTIEGARIDTATLEAATIAVARETPATIGPPLRGGVWFATNAPSNDSRHRRVLVTFNRRVELTARFAFDWVKYRDGALVPDPATYGSEALAVLDATVVTAVDGIPDNWVPGQEPASRDARAVPMTVETVNGNSVVLDLGGGKYARYSHFQPGSVRVKPGDRVRRGQVLGLVGNSGNSNGPHLHFNISTNSGHGGDGLPFVFDSLDVVAAPPLANSRGLPAFIPKGQQARRGEMPLHRWAIRFP